MDQTVKTVNSEISDEEFKKMKCFLYESAIEHVQKTTKGILNLVEDMQNLLIKTVKSEDTIVEVLSCIEAYE